jgi:hypothetical protein
MIDSSDFQTKRMPLNHRSGQMRVLFGTLIPDDAATIRAKRDALVNRSSDQAKIQ